MAGRIVLTADNVASSRFSIAANRLMAVVGISVGQAARIASIALFDAA